MNRPLFLRLVDWDTAPAALYIRKLPFELMTGITESLSPCMLMRLAAFSLLLKNPTNSFIPIIGFINFLLARGLAGLRWIYLDRGSRGFKGSLNILETRKLVSERTLACIALA